MNDCRYILIKKSEKGRYLVKTTTNHLAFVNIKKHGFTNDGYAIPLMCDTVDEITKHIDKDYSTIVRVTDVVMVAEAFLFNNIVLK